MNPVMACVTTNLPENLPSRRILKRQEEIICAFNQGAGEYDGWFDDNPVFKVELAALNDLAGLYLAPRLEIGIGTGRFAKELQIDFGIDPALAPLKIARGRGIKVVLGTGEDLPFAPGSIGSIFLLFTLSFLTDPDKVLAECSRLLKHEGVVVGGIVPSKSPWGEQLTLKAKQGNPFYRHARLRTVAELKQLFYKNGYKIIASRSTLYQHPQGPYNVERLRSGPDEQAGFCIFVARINEQWT